MGENSHKRRGEAKLHQNTEIFLDHQLAMFKEESLFHFFLEECSDAMNRIIKENEGAKLSDILAMEVKSYQQLTALHIVSPFQKSLLNVNQCKVLPGYYYCLSYSSECHLSWNF